MIRPLSLCDERAFSILIIGDDGHISLSDIGEVVGCFSHLIGSYFSCLSMDGVSCSIELVCYPSFDQSDFIISYDLTLFWVSARFCDDLCLIRREDDGIEMLY
jgi:hypothetical protein